MRVFILEDDCNRMAGFDLALQHPNVEVTHAVFLEGEGGAFSFWKPPYDIVLLDHDLGGRAYVPSDGDEETGYKFVKFLVENPPSEPIPHVIIHSHNPDGADKMFDKLHEAGFCKTISVHPFGKRLLAYLKEAVYDAE